MLAVSSNTAPSSAEFAEVEASPCWLAVDLDTIAANVRAIRLAVGSSTQVMAVGEGGRLRAWRAAVPGAALRAGASWLAVARIDEGVALRKAGIGAPILDLACTLPEEAELAVEYRIRPTIVDLATARALAAAAPNGRFPVHLKVDQA